MPLDPLEHPLGVLTEHPVLAAEAEAGLITTLRAGVEARVAIRNGLLPTDPQLLRRVALGDQARATLARHNLRLVVSIAKRYLRLAGPHLTLEDLVSFGAIGLLQGIDKFDPAKSGKLSTYVTWWIRQAIGRGIAEESRVIDLPVHMHERLSQYHKARSRLAQKLSLVTAIWQSVLQLGLGSIERPRILEPAAGVGHFISAMPPELRERAEVTAIELDPVTARILGHIHSDITLHGGLGFERVDLPPNGFDLAISNVPFGEMAVHDPCVPAALRHTVHDYFFGKALRLVRPGGLVVFLTSWGTLDKQVRAVRTFLAEQATLLGAFRLPNGVFRRISGSEGATDLLILQKKPQPAAEEPSWLTIAEADYPRSTDHRSMTVGSRYTREIKDPELLADARVAVNQCWLDEPERVIGQTTVVVASDNRLWLQVVPPTEDLATVLHRCLVALLPSGIVEPAGPDVIADVPMPITPPLHERRADQIAIPALGGIAQERAAGMASMYNAAKALICAELNDEPGVDAARAELNQAYEQFIFQFGVIHDPRNQKLFGDLPELQFLLALERNPRRTPSRRWRAERERIFFERTLRPHQPALPGTLSPTEALLRCLDE
jgi:RNA polymerase sigma factor (sigma-70 family)